MRKAARVLQILTFVILFIHCDKITLTTFNAFENNVCRSSFLLPSSTLLYPQTTVLNITCEIPEIIQQLSEFTDANTLITKLKEYNKQGVLAVGFKDDFGMPDECYVFIVDESYVYETLFYKNNLYFNIKTNQAYQSLKNQFINKDNIWVIEARKLVNHVTKDITAQNLVPLLTIQTDISFSEISGVELDGELNAAIKAFCNGNKIQLRGPKYVKSELRSGLHNIGVWLKDQKETFYFWKERNNLKQFFKKNTGNNYALLIGIAYYYNGFNELPEVTSQVRELRDILEKNNFEVISLFDAEQNVTLKSVEDAIAELNKKMNVNKDRLLFYYGGHGLAFKPPFGDSLAYLILNDYDHQNLEKTCISMDDIFMGDYMKHLQARHVLFAIDACVASIGRRMAKPDSVSLREFMDLNFIYQLIKDRGRTVFTAGAGAQEAIDESGEGGIFTTAFIEALKGVADLRYGDKNGVTTMNELEDYLRRRVTGRAKMKGFSQEPARFDFGSGEFVFFHYLSPFKAMQTN